MKSEGLNPSTLFLEASKGVAASLYLNPIIILSIKRKSIKESFTFVIFWVSNPGSSLLHYPIEKIYEGKNRIIIF